MAPSADLRDRYDLPLGTGSAAAAEHYVDGIDRLLSQSVGADAALATAVDADPGFALAHAALAAAYQAHGNGSAAKESSERAVALVSGASRRERQHVEVVATAVSGEALRTLELACEHLAEFPRDVLLVHQANAVFQFGGLPDRQQRRFDLFARMEPAYGEDWYFLSAFSFVHHELDMFEQSRRLSERSLELYPANANATHNLGHVFYETNDHSGGAAFLSGWIAGYDRQAPMHGHLSWHLALAELAAGHYDRAMEVYDSSISPAVSSARNTLQDAASFLWRWQIYGCDDGKSLPWQTVCELAGRIAPKPGLAFADAHAALAYAAAGDEAALGSLVDGLRALDARGHALAGPIVLPLVNAIAAFARGQYLEAICLLEPISDQIVRIGGSNAQREVFQDTLLEAYLRAGRFEQAESLLRQRLERRPSARDRFWLGRAQAGAGRDEDASISLASSRGCWSGAEPGATEQRRMEALSERADQN